MIGGDVKSLTAVSAHKEYLMIIISIMQKNRFPSVLLCNDKHLVALFYILFTNVYDIKNNTNTVSSISFTRNLPANLSILCNKQTIPNMT